MKTVSKTSKARIGSPRSSRGHEPARSVVDSHDADKRWLELIAPPNVRGRRREARRWIDALTVRMTNGRVCERRPGQKLLSVAEGMAIADALQAALRRDDPELNRVVERLEWEDGTRDLGTTIEEWKIRSHRRSIRIAKVRAEMQREGLV